MAGTSVNKTYQKSDNGLSVIDNIDGDITSSPSTAVTVSVIDTANATTGTPLVQTITATDAAGNVSTKDINVTVTSAFPA